MRSPPGLDTEWPFEIKLFIPAALLGLGQGSPQNWRSPWTRGSEGGRLSSHGALSTSPDRQLGAGVSSWSTRQPTQRYRPQAVTQSSRCCPSGWGQGSAFLASSQGGSALEQGLVPAGEPVQPNPLVSAAVTGSSRQVPAGR